jgi:membrane protein implicated in regulation of membrane protease activity
MSIPVIWFVLAFATLAAELMAGTLYLLMFAAGFAAAGAAGIAGVSLTGQLLVAALVSVIGCIFLRVFRSKRADAQPQLDFDRGQPVEIIAPPAADAALQVNYRGSMWQATLADGLAYEAGRAYVVQSIRGSVLVITPKL